MADRLYEMGFAVQPVAEGETIEQQWYRPDDVGELSREEAYVIARRVVPAFTLHEGFVSNNLSAADTHGALNSACARAVAAATRGRLGADRATALGRAIETDLATQSAFKD